MKKRTVDLYPYRLIFPALAIETVFVLAPLLIGVYYSLHHVRYLEIRGFVGIQNYLNVLTSPAVLNSLMVTAVFSISALVLTFAMGFALALYLERDGRTNVFLRAVVLVPYVISMLVGSMLLKWIFSQDSGLPQMVTGALGTESISVFADPKLSMGALVFNAFWRDTAFAMMLLLAGLKGISPQLFDAARIDGASMWMRFTRITLPLMQVPILITLVRLLLHFVNILTYTLILTGGGPNQQTESVVLRIFRIGFEDQALGRANALAFSVFAANLVLVFFLFKLFKRSNKGL